MQIVSVPLFDKNMVVEAYFLRCRKGGGLLSTDQIASIFDGAARSEALEALNYVGLDAFTLGKPIVVPINSIILLSRLDAQCTQPPEKIIFLLENLPRPDLIDGYVLKMDELRKSGYRFAVSGMPGLGQYAPLLQRCSYCFMNQSAEQAEASNRQLDELKRNYRDIIWVAADIGSADLAPSLHGKGYNLFESRCFNVGDTLEDTNVPPLKMNAIRLLNTVQDNDFEFEQIAKIVQGDPALVISLLQMVNARTFNKNKIKSISQAVALLGQQEVRKWVTTAVAQSLGSDRPNEITKISLVRARFAENLAPLFEMAHMAQGLFLMGLFSVLDIILAVPMPKALEMISVSDMIRNSLVERSGIYYPVLNMLVSYESADWVTVSRLMIIHDIEAQSLTDAYIEAMIWYKSIIMPEDDTDSPAADGQDDS